MFIPKKGHQPGVYVPLRALFLVDVRILFPLNILRTNGQNLTKFCIHIYINNI